MPLDQAAIHAAVMAALRGEDASQATTAAPPPASHGGVGIAPYAAAVGGPLADLGTTLDAFSRGAREANSLYGGDQPKTALIISKAAQAVLMPLIMQRLAASGHPTAAKALGYVTGGIGGGMAINNSLVNR